MNLRRKNTIDMVYMLIVICILVLSTATDYVHNLTVKSLILHGLIYMILVLVGKFILDYVVSNKKQIEIDISMFVEERENENFNNDLYN